MFESQRKGSYMGIDDSQRATSYMGIDVIDNLMFPEDIKYMLGCVVGDRLRADRTPDLLNESGGVRNTYEFRQIKDTITGFMDEEHITYFTDVYADPQSQTRIQPRVNLTSHCADFFSLERLAIFLHATQFNGEVASQVKSDFQQATGSRYHLRNAAQQFENRLWTNPLYRQALFAMIEQKRKSGEIETLTEKSDRRKHTCEVVVLPMIVGVLTSHGRRRKLEEGVFDDEVVIAMAYDLVAIPTGKRDPEGRFAWATTLLDITRKCHACEDNKLPYPAAWHHGPVTRTRHGVSHPVAKLEDADPADMPLELWSGHLPSDNIPTKIWSGHLRGDRDPEGRGAGSPVFVDFD